LPNLISVARISAIIADEPILFCICDIPLHHETALLNTNALKQNKYKFGTLPLVNFMGHLKTLNSKKGIRYDTIEEFNVDSKAE